MTVSAPVFLSISSSFALTADMFKALCDENRVRILKLLQGGEKCACVLLDDLRITQPTLSHDLKQLIDAGIVKSRRDGQRTLYSLNMEVLEKMQRRLIKMLEAE